MTVRFGEAVEDGFLPVFSVDTEAEAHRLLVMVCPKNLAGEFISRELAHGQTLENLQRFSDRLAEFYPLAREDPP